jgi:hypothetical protein
LEQYLFLGKGNQKALVAGVYRLTWKITRIYVYHMGRTF